jgi:GNAT superfamily N-acetyltransferase
MTRTVPIEAAGPDRIPVLADVFSRAFIDDPIVRWPLPDVRDIGARIRQTFASIYLGVADRGMIWEAGDAEGFAVWIPPGAADDMFASDAAVQLTLAPLTDDDGRRYAALWEWIESQVPDDVWYLDAIGVEPSRQGTGIGGALIRHGLSAASDEGVDAFLETGTARNVPYYERFGFVVVGEGAPTRDGPHIWFMRTGR